MIFLEKFYQKILDPMLHRAWLVIVVSFGLGLLSVFSFAPYSMAWVSVVSLAFLYLFLNKSSSWQMSWAIAFAFGAGLYGFGVYWLGLSMSGFGDLSFMGVLGATLFVIVVQAIFFSVGGIGFYFVDYCLKKVSARYLIARTGYLFLHLLLFATVMTLSEWIRTQNDWGMAWLFFGYIHVDTPLYSLAPVIGVFGLSWLNYLIASFFVVFFMLEKRYWQLLLCVVVTLIFLSSVWLKGVEWTKKTGKSLKVMAIQGDQNPDLKWEADYAMQTYNHYKSLALGGEDVDLVIFSETFVTFYYRSMIPFLNDFIAQMRSKERGLIFGMVDDRTNEIDRKLYNAAFAYDVMPTPMASDLPSGAEPDFLPQIYQKENMVLFGEYTPFWLADLAKMLLNFPFSTLQPGKTLETTLSIKGFNLAPFICYDISFPRTLINHAKNSQALVEISEEVWFGRSISQPQHLQMARMRVLESQRMMARTSNGGITAIIDIDGSIVSALPRFTQDILIGSLEGRTGQTPLMRYYDWILRVMAGYVFIFIFWAGLIEATSYLRASRVLSANQDKRKNRSEKKNKH